MRPCARVHHLLPVDSRNYITVSSADDLIEDPCMWLLIFHFFKIKNKVFHAVYVSSALPNADTWLFHVGTHLSLHCYGVSISANCTLLDVQGMPNFVFSQITLVSRFSEQFLSSSLT